MSVVTIVEFQFLPDDLGRRIEFFRTVLAQTAAFPGCESLELLSDVADPARMTVVIRWASQDDDTAYGVWRKTPEGASNLTPHLASPPVRHVHVPI